MIFEEKQKKYRCSVILLIVGKNVKKKAQTEITRKEIAQKP